MRRDFYCWLRFNFIGDGVNTLICTNWLVREQLVRGLQEFGASGPKCDADVWLLWGELVVLWVRQCQNREDVMSSKR